jgi:hypothetical protein
MIDGGLIVVWLGDEGIHIWDTKKGELLQVSRLLIGMRPGTSGYQGMGPKFFS